MIKLGFGLKYSDLYSTNGLYKIDKLFLHFLKKENDFLYKVLVDYRTKKYVENFDSDQLISISKIQEKFIGKIFGIENEILHYHKSQEFTKQLYTVKRNFVHRVAVQKYKKEDINQQKVNEDFFRLVRSPVKDKYDLDKLFILLLDKYKENTTEYVILAKYAASRIHFGPTSDLFSKPHKIDFENLINFSTNGYLLEKTGQEQISKSPYLEAHYCINCHKTEKDTCREGIKYKNAYKSNPLGNILKGCPLKIKISEMNEVFSNGYLISALSIISCNNPIVALTGKRICNDCSKACIYQKQEPVDIPSIESKILEDVLSLPYGFEIYSLLTAWQPLNQQEYLPSEYRGKKVLVVGTGPSGIALSYYLQRAGCYVVVIDALKIEPIPKHLIINPVKHISELKKSYEKIKPQGFGGVAEYGITDRWDKSNLLVSRLLLEKRKNFELHGGIKFGSNITYEQTKILGFESIALCCGSGYPQIPVLENISAGNVRTASDFLMSLGAGGANLEKSHTNFLVLLPAVVVGGGLTAVDAATQITKYYPFLAKKLYLKFKNKDLPFLTEAEKKQVEILVEHGERYYKEDLNAKKENRSPDYLKINDEFGGITILYRKNIKESPSYKINHEELGDALFHGIRILENADLESIEKDQYSNCSGVRVKLPDGGEKLINAKTILFATGTSPLTKKDISNGLDDKPDILVFGDMDPDYSGSVVKAIASVRDNYKKILNNISTPEKIYKKISSHYKYFTATVTENISHTDEIFELKIRNKFSAQNFVPGQFF